MAAEEGIELQMVQPISITLKCELPARDGVHGEIIQEHTVEIPEDFYTNSWLLTQAMNLYIRNYDDEHPDFTQLAKDGKRALLLLLYAYIISICVSV